MERASEYLGDGVYAKVDGTGRGIVIETNNGVEVTNAIYLQWEVLDALGKFVINATDKAIGDAIGKALKKQS